MNLHEQIGALEAGVDQLLVAATARTSRIAEAASADQTDAAETAAAARSDAAGVPHANDGHAQAVVDADPTGAAETTVASAAANDSSPEAGTPAQTDATQPESAGSAPTLTIGRPSQNEITMTIAGQTVSLNPLQVGQLIEELSNARASMQPEPPPGIPAGWRFASTKNPMMAVQKQSNGDRLLVMRHTGHGWVPFTFSPDVVVQMYMMLTQR